MSLKKESACTLRITGTRIYLYIFLFCLGISFCITETAYPHGPLTGKGFKEDVQIGPNGGKLKRYKNKYTEFTFNQKMKEIKLFLLNDKKEVVKIPEKFSGMIYLKVSGKPGTWLDLEKVDSNSVSFLRAHIKAKSEFEAFSALVGLSLGGERENFRFIWTENEGS